MHKLPEILVGILFAVGLAALARDLYDPPKFVAPKANDEGWWGPWADGLQTVFTFGILIIGLVLGALVWLMAVSP